MLEIDKFTKELDDQVCVTDNMQATQITNTLLHHTYLLNCQVNAGKVTVTIYSFKFVKVTFSLALVAFGFCEPYTTSKISTLRHFPSPNSF